MLSSLSLKLYRIRRGIREVTLFYILHIQLDMKYLEYSISLSGNLLFSSYNNPCLPPAALKNKIETTNE